MEIIKIQKSISIVSRISPINNNIYKIKKKEHKQIINKFDKKL